MLNRQIVKVCLLGSGDDLSRFVSHLKNHQILTIGVDFFNYLDPDSTITYQIWDLRGRERFKSLSKSYLKDAVAIICFNMDEAAINSYKQSVPDHCQFLTYNPQQMTPETCLRAIQLEPNAELVADVNDKIMLLLAASYSKDSIFNTEMTPLEITGQIAEKLVDAAFKNDRISFSFFKLSKTTAIHEENVQRKGCNLF